MFKMMIVLLSLVFTVAACNKNNSKADRVKKDPALAGTPAPAAGQKTTDPKLSLEQNKNNAEEQGQADEVLKPLGGKNTNSNSGTPAGTATPDATKDTTDKSVVAGSSASGGVLTEEKPGPTAPGQEGKKSASDLNTGAKITFINSMNYSLVDMTTEQNKNYIDIPALLDSGLDKARKARFHCYENSNSKGPALKDGPEIMILTNSEVLVEVRKSGAPLDDVILGPTPEGLDGKFVLGVCKGKDTNTSAVAEEYDLKKIKADESYSDYLRVDSGDRDMVEISVLCSHQSNLSAKMDRQKNDKNAITNRLTLSAGSKIMFLRPIGYKQTDAQTKKTATLKEIKNFKDYSVIECE